MMNMHLRKKIVIRINRIVWFNVWNELFPKSITFWIDYRKSNIKRVRERERHRSFREDSSDGNKKYKESEQTNKKKNLTPWVFYYTDVLRYTLLVVEQMFQNKTILQGIFFDISIKKKRKKTSSSKTPPKK